jgi:signal transduction histidine kinase
MLFPSIVLNFWALSAPEIAPAPAVRAPGELPFRLDAGWEAADADPMDGAARLDRLRWRPADPSREPGPQESVRWYRVRLDLAALRGTPVAFSSLGIRHVDEAFFDGVRIGGQGAFPPALRPAPVQPRLYALPTDRVNGPGTHVLALRIYHARGRSPVFRHPPSLTRLTLSTQRAWADQTLVFVAGVGSCLVTTFLTFMIVTGHRRLHLTFAGLVSMIVIYLLCGHSAWSSWPGPPHVPFRLGGAAGALICAFYVRAVWTLRPYPPPRRFHAYCAAFVAYALADLTFWDVSIDPVPTWFIRALALVCVADLVPITWSAARDRVPGARGALVTHLLLALGVIWLNVTFLPVNWFYGLAAAALMGAAFGLYRTGLKQVEVRFLAVCAERSRIARHLHDTLACGLTGISLQLDALAASLPDPPPDVRQPLRRAQELVRSTMEEARASVQALRRSAGSRALPEALREAARQLTGRGRPPVQIEVKGPVRTLPAPQEDHLLCIGREALTNAVRHSRAGHIRVGLTYAEDAVHLRVSDDGVGLPPDACAAADDGFGLLGMRERAQQIGGRLCLKSAPGQGTDVQVTVPARLGTS